jgi:Zn-dependent metalloprotease
MPALRVRPIAFLLLAGLALGACGGGGSDDDGGDFVVAPLPASFLDGGENNQAPEDERMEPRPVRRTPIEVVPLDEAGKADAEEDALRLARFHLAATGFPRTTDVQVVHLLQDEFGGVHVKMEQTHGGLPVIGAGLVSHLYPNDPDDVTPNLVEGLDLDLAPVVLLMDAQNVALTRYPGSSSVALDVKTRLAVLPELEVVRVRFGHVEDNTEDFDRRLAGARLVWEILVEPQMPDLALVAGAGLPGAAVNEEPDDTLLTLLRDENVTRGGNESTLPAADNFATQVLAPGVRLRIDADTGEILSEETLIQHADELEEAEGPGWGYLHGKVALDTSYWPPNGKHYLIDVSRPKLYGLAGLGNIVWDAKNLETHDAADMTLFADGNDSWGDGLLLNTASAAYGTTRRQTPGVDVAFAVQMTWDFFQHVLGRWGLDGLGTPLNAAVHWGDGYSDAHYNGSSKFIVFGDGTVNGKPGNYSLSTVGHELGHWFWHASGNGSEAGESSALNEGHGDIQGSLVDLYRGTGSGLGTQVRHFSNFSDWRGRMVDPAGYSEESGGDTYVGLKYWSSTLKDGPEHVGGLPFGRAFIYLAEGAPSDSSNTLWTTEYPNGLGGIGHTKAAHIWKTAIAYYLGGTPTYSSVRTAFIDAAEYLYGAPSMEHRAVRRSFAAIRVGSGATDNVDPDITYAKIYSVNLEDMTALVHAEVDEDTGIRELRVSGAGVTAVLPADWLVGYASIARTQVGTRSTNFTVTDSAGKTDVVARQFVKARDNNLIVNGDFEDGMDGWTSAQGKDQTGFNEARAFLGSGYLAPEDEDLIWQEVTIPSDAENPTLVFRLLVRDSAASHDSMDVSILSPGGDLLSFLEAYTWSTPPDTRNWLNKGYLRQEFDLSAFVGDTIRIAFVNHTFEGARRFVVDQVVLTFTREAVVGAPEVHLHPWENTVAFSTPLIEGVTPAEIARVDYYVDGVYRTAGATPHHDYYGGLYLHQLAPGPHWVAAVVRGLDNSILGASQGVWFEPGNVNELLVNRGFEDGAWDLTYSGVPPKVLVVEDVLDSTIAFDGSKALRMGAQGTAHESQAGQVVEVPNTLNSLRFSIRVRVFSEESVIPSSNGDELWLETWNANTYQKLEEHRLVGSWNQYDIVGDHDWWANYGRAEVSLSTAKHAGKDVIVLLKVKEDSGAATSFYLDNASLRWTSFGYGGN